MMIKNYWLVVPLQMLFRHLLSPLLQLLAAHSPPPHWSPGLTLAVWVAAAF